jgi:hypothetical protein
VTRWVTRSGIIGVTATIALAGAATAAAAATAATALTGVSPAGTSSAAVGVRAQRPIGDYISAMLGLAGVRTCVDWRQGVSGGLQPCQSTPSEPVTTGELAYGAAGATGTTSDGNLAAGRPTAASSALLGSPAAHAVDGSLDTAWRTRGDDQWWAVDLGGATSLATVVLNWDGSELPTGYSLLTSTDGTKWKRVGKPRGRPNGGPTVLDAAVRARFVRVSVDGPASSGVALRDMRAFAPVAPPPDKRASRDRREDVRVGGYGADAGAGAPLSELPDGSEAPEIATGPLPDAQATGFGPATDPVTTAAVLVIVLAGVTSLVVGAQTTKGRHRRKRRRLPPPLTPPSLPKATPSRSRSKPAPLTPPSLPKAPPATPARAAPPLTPPSLPKAPPLTPPSLPKAPPLTPPSLPKAPPVTPPSAPAAKASPSRPPRAVPARRAPHTPRPPIEIRWPDWAKLEWVRPNRAKPGRPAQRDT